MKYIAVRAHHPEAPDVLDVGRGERLKFERRDTVYPGWIWCLGADGHQAWVPEAYVAIEGDGCRMQKDYVSRELAIEVGEVVEIVEATSGWALVRTGEHERGWVPLDCLEGFASVDADG